jgi:broad specificity phosphatase PhoE
VADAPIAYVSRHGRTILNVQGQLKGFLDAELDEVGVEQAKMQAKFLKHLGIKRILTSPLLRAVETAKIFAEEVGLNVEERHELATWDVGVLAGISKDECADAIKLFLENPSVNAPYGQSIDNFEEQLAELFGAELPNSEKDGPYAFFTHNSDITALSNMVKGNRHANVELEDAVDTGGIVAVYVEEKGYRLEVIFEPEEAKEAKEVKSEKETPNGR